MCQKCFMREIARSRQRELSFEMIPDKINEVIPDTIRMRASRLRNDATAVLAMRGLADSDGPVRSEARHCHGPRYIYAADCVIVMKTPMLSGDKCR
jgi:hypothetical protein